MIYIQFIFGLVCYFIIGIITTKISVNLFIKSWKIDTLLRSELERLEIGLLFNIFLWPISIPLTVINLICSEIFKWILRR